MLGTLYPLALDALGLGKISVGAPYFEAVFVPLMAPVVLLMGIGPLARWKQASLGRHGSQRLKWPALASVAAALLLPWLGRPCSARVALGLFLAAWVFTGTAACCCVILQRTRGGAGNRLECTPVAQLLGHGGGAPGRGRVHRRRDHGARAIETERDVKMSYVGDHVEVGRLPHHGSRASVRSTGPNYVAGHAARSTCSAAARRPSRCSPEKRLYKVQQHADDRSRHRRGLTRDLYVSLGEMLDDKTWTVRVYHKPFVNWIWGGALRDGPGRPAGRCNRPPLPGGRQGRTRVPRRPLPSRLAEAHAGEQQAAPHHERAGCSSRWAVRSCSGVLLGAGLGLNPREVPSPFIGKPAPAFSLPR